jgi:hypothetical protein
MANLPTRQEVARLHGEMASADAKFRAELTRQFGPMADAKRLADRDHDARTAFARDQFKQAWDAWRIAVRHRNAVEALQYHA